MQIRESLPPEWREHQSLNILLTMTCDIERNPATQRKVPSDDAFRKLMRTLITTNSPTLRRLAAEAQLAARIRSITEANGYINKR